MLHKASDLSFEHKTAIESLLGRAISEGETVSVRAFEPSPMPDEKRRGVLAGLDAYFARIDAKSQTVSDQEAEAVFNEALRSTRSNYLPIR